MIVIRGQHILRKILNFSVVVCCILFLTGCEEGLDTTTMEEQWSVNVANCWPCTLYKVVFDAIGSVLKSVYETVADLSFSLLGIGLLFWLAFTIGRLVISLKQPNIPEYVSLISKTLFKALIVSAVLFKPEYFLAMADYIVTPIITTFASLSRVVLLADPQVAEHFVVPESLTKMETDYPLFTGEVGYQVQDVIYRIYAALNSGISLGVTLMATPALSNWIIGPFIIWIFFNLMIIFPLMFIESFIRLGCVLILSPIILVTWVFPSTKGYIKKAWDIIFGSMFQIFMACIFIAIMVNIIYTYTDANYPGILTNSKQTNDPKLLSELQRLSSTSIGFLALLVCILKLSGSIPKISGYFGGNDQQSEFVKIFNGLKQLSINATKLAVGALMVYTGVGASLGASMVANATIDMKNQAKDVGDEALKELTDMNSKED